MATNKMQQLFPRDPLNLVPSFEWFRRQFTPRNPYSNISKTLTGLFNATRGLKQRLLRKSLKKIMEQSSFVTLKNMHQGRI